MLATTLSSSAWSASVHGVGALKVARLSSSCSMVVMPLRITPTFASDCSHRNAQEAMDASGRAALSSASASAPGAASLPPRTGSITHTGMPRSVRISYFRRAFCTTQSK